MKYIPALRRIQRERSTMSADFYKVGEKSTYQRRKACQLLIKVSENHKRQMHKHKGMTVEDAARNKGR